MTLSSIIIAWPAYLLLEVVVRYIGFIRSTESSQRNGKFWRFSSFCLISPGWAVADYFKSRIRDAEGNKIADARKKFILSNNTDNIIVSALLLSLPIAIQTQDLFVPDIVIGFLFWRFMSRSFEISRAFVDDILNTKNDSGIKQRIRIKLALKSYVEIFIYSAALYSVLSPYLASLENATLGALYVGTLTNVTFVTQHIEEKHLVFVQIFATLSLIVLSIAGYLSNAKGLKGAGSNSGKTVQINPKYEDVVAWLRPKVKPWRKFTIAIDGVDNAGKSSLARFLAWQLGMPVIETDLVVKSDCTVPKPDAEILLKLINSRHECNRPVIVEGVFILRTLDAIAITPDVLIRVCATGRDGSHTWEQEFSDYESKFPRSNQPDYEVLWQPND